MPRNSKEPIKWQVALQVKSTTLKVSKRKLVSLAKQILSQVDCSKLVKSKVAELSIVLTDDLEIRELNRQYRGKDYATDVLSFALLEDSPSTEGEIITPIGDIVISLDKVIAQAKEYDVNDYQELLRLLIHGILHLLGYDHEDVAEEEAEKMRAAEERIYQNLLADAAGLIV